MWTLVVRHIYTNRGWFLRLFRGHYDARRRLAAALHVALMANMLLLVGTSLAISQSVWQHERERGERRRKGRNADAKEAEGLIEHVSKGSARGQGHEHCGPDAADDFSCP